MAHYDADMESDFDGAEPEYTIYVNNLPPELDKVAIRQVFSQYGLITEMMYPNNATWAYITYKSYREAELAIRELNEKKPLYLKVALAKGRSVIKKEESQKSYVPKTFEGSSNARDSIAETLLSTCSDIKQQENGSSLSSLHGSLQGLNAYGLEEPLNTNRLWSRGVVTVTPDGRRHVALGRGYTRYEYPAPEPKLEEYIAKVYEKRHMGLYEHGEDKLEIRKCFICFIKTTRKCEKCNTYYCSELCQRRDWPRHRVECECIPKLVEETVNDMSLLQISKDENQTKISKLNLTGKTIAPEVKLRRPNASNTMQMENSNSTNASPNMQQKSNMDMNSSIDNGTNNQDMHLSTRHDNNTNASCIKTADQPILNTTNTIDFSKQHQSHRYNNSKGDTEKLRRSDEYSSATSNYKNQNRSSHQNGAIKKTSPRDQERFTNNSNLRDRNYNSDKNQSYQRNESQNNRKFTACNRENANREGNNSSNNNLMNDNITFYNDMYLSETEFTEVEISISLSNGEYWICKTTDTEARERLMIKLLDVARKSHNVQPIVGGIYAVLFETAWQRAMIISLNPTKVHFIDYGNDEMLQKDAEIREIPESLTKVPNFARKIRLSSTSSEQYKNFKYNDKILVRMLSIDAEKTIIVDIKEQSKNIFPHVKSSPNMNNVKEEFVRQENLKASNESINLSTIERPNTLDILANLLTQKADTKHLEGFIIINECIQENRYGATLFQSTLELERLFSNLKEDNLKMQECAPKVNELICGERNNNWVRGYIIQSSTSSDLRMIAIDEGRIMTVTKIVPCPKELQDICVFGVICEVKHPDKLNVEDIYEFRAVENEQNCKQENITLKISKDSEFVCEAVVKSWKSIIPKNSKPLPALSEIKNGSKICITSYRNPSTVFVRSLDEEAVEYYNNIMQCVAQCARTAPYLKELPNNRQSVIAPYSDGNSYRAMVVKTQNDKAQVVYTDFGNVDEVNIKELQILPENLALQRSCSAKLILKDVPSDISENAEVDLFLRKLAGDETPLTCVHEGDLNGVYLTAISTKQSINDEINKLLIPNWKRNNCHDDKTCYNLNHVEVANLGEVGKTINALVLHVQEEGGSLYYMSPYDIELYAYITEVLPNMLMEYCEKTEHYIPRQNELCLALYQGTWYRAICINPNQSQTTAEVIYIDYGNQESVEHKNIRLIPKDFLTPSAMANMCKVVNLAPVDNTGNYSPAIKRRLAELIPKNKELIVKIKIVEVISQQSGEYNIELVEIKNKLIEEGLIPPS
ncbi:tudor domain-containing protein 1-like isoform X2 [Nylanderia fulva]|uniref:tudor domain-containing protein 1-like isoform X2 n=1 Tax=Nylanderia fulva TaxID=613905 RepID=UPI0010FBB28F|nr:tudor domain-containing protein 1-like isoform X2 [Nylanderia fulva]